jgi:hypothetical protein
MLACRTEKNGLILSLSLFRSVNRSGQITRSVTAPSARGCGTRLPAALPDTRASYIELATYYVLLQQVLRRPQIVSMFSTNLSYIIHTSILIVFFCWIDK